MENRTSIRKKNDDINKRLNTESVNISNENSIEIVDNSNKSQTDIKEDKIKKTKELIRKLLKESLDKKLIISEKKSSNQITLIKTEIKSITSLTKDIEKWSKQIEEKIKKDKKKYSKIKQNRYGGGKRRGLSPHKPNNNNNTNRSSHYRAKTPSHLNKTGTDNRDKSSSIYGIKRELIKSRASMGMRSSKTIQVERSSRAINSRQKFIVEKRKSSLNLKKINQMNDSNLDELQTISITSLKTNKTNTSSLNTVNNSRTNIKNPVNKNNNKKMKIININNNVSCNTSDKNLIHIKKKKTNNSSLNTEEKKKRRKTPVAKKIGNNDDSSSKIINSSKKMKKTMEKTIKDEIVDILDMEYNLQKETGLNDNDPLLILPLKDLDFVPKGLLRRNSIRAENPQNYRKYLLSSFNLEENLNNIQLNNILKYLSINDLLLVKNLSKKFHQLIIAYLMEYLGKEKKSITDIKDNLNLNEKPNREGFDNFELSKGSKKAVLLLNEPELRCLFKQENTPIYEILLIYRIYFQIINHPFALIAKVDMDQFWEKCRNYFLNENNGNSGDVLMTMINEKKIDISRNNLYQIYNLVKGNLEKMVPKYYMEMCGTTGLFVFIIKEILEFLGISKKIKKKENAYWTYTDIIDSIDDKINYLNKSNI